MLKATLQVLVEGTAGYGQALVLSQNSIPQHCFWRHRPSLSAHTAWGNTCREVLWSSEVPGGFALSYQVFALG